MRSLALLLLCAAACGDGPTGLASQTMAAACDHDRQLCGDEAAPCDDETTWPPSLIGCVLAAKTCDDARGCTGSPDLSTSDGPTAGDEARPIDAARADETPLRDAATPPAPDLAVVADAAVPPDVALAIDLAVAPDLTAKSDLATAPDASPQRDLATPPDLGGPVDFAVPPDLAPPPDLKPLDLAGAGLVCTGSWFGTPSLETNVAMKLAPDGASNELEISSTALAWWERQSVGFLECGLGPMTATATEGTVECGLPDIAGSCTVTGLLYRFGYPVGGTGVGTCSIAGARASSGSMTNNLTVNCGGSGPVTY